MKKVLLLSIFLYSITLHAQNVGINTTTPKAMLHVKDSAVLFSAGLPAGTPSRPPEEGTGSRMMWYAAKAAFRSGEVDNNAWVDGNIGIASFATGYNTRASGFASMAAGQNSIAAGGLSMALGENATATGNYSIAVGSLTQAAGTTSTAIGSGSIASGPVSTAMGQQTIAAGYGATAMGLRNTAVGSSATATGLSTLASGSNSFSMGEGTVARASHSLVIGKYNDSIASSNLTTWVNSDPLFYIGNGTSEAERHNAMVVYKSGGLVMSNYAPLYVSTEPFTIPVTGAGTKMMWIPDRSAFRAGTATGSQWDYMGAWSFGFGVDSRADGSLSLCGGTGSQATVTGATAIGQFASATGAWSWATGANTTASGFYSTAMGFHSTATAYASLSIGQYNDPVSTSNHSSWVNTDPLFILGNGTSDAARTNALVVYKNGDADINGFTQLGSTSDAAPRIKIKKLTGTLPSSANPNTWVFLPTGVNPSKILSVTALVTDGVYQFLPFSNQTGYVYTVNVDNANIAVGVQSVISSSSVMSKPVKILVTYEE